MSNQRIYVQARMASLLGTAKVAAWLGVLAVTLVVITGCATNEREDYFGARGTIFSAQAGDSSSIVSQVNGQAAIARVGDE